ncbi:DUF2092 domain-containing protein [Microbulbifer halophilus]|uniref:DUF2092 domain-containing protein n=1 Tax=Microbulbifer halophilus TaxID=453963 RepID=A0ABW5EGU4_9GAMM|nr:DUF2092 domain-containing protein [Microbulbifer halophilus]MCW8128594.1 DUF2092 domain-containing protein [Microbulbifer halophilus]
MQSAHSAISCTVLAGLLALAPVAGAVERARAGTEKGTGKEAEIEKSDPAALAALERMDKALAGRESLALDAQLSTEVILANGQKVLIGGESRVRFRRPDHLKMELKTDSFHRLLFHDGARLTLFDKDRNYVGELEMKTDSRTALVVIARDYEIEMPLADLLEWGTPGAAERKIEAAYLVGQSRVQGRTVQHWAFRGPRLDWEIWLPMREGSLPVKISTVNKSIEGSPRYIATIQWRKAEKLPASLFRPKLPEEVKKIPFRQIKSAEVKDD